MSLKKHIVYLLPYLVKVRSIRYLFVLSCCSFLISMLWIEFTARQKRAVNESLIPEALENVRRDLRYKNVYRKPKYLPKNLKYLLIWSHRNFSPFSYLEEGQRTFLRNNCSVFNCYVTADKNLFGDDYTKFDAIAFNGRTMKAYHVPRRRSPKQKYIFFNMESSANHPVCSPIFDRFFNLTATYKLDSDIPIPYILVREKNNVIVGPKPNMVWKTNPASEENKNAELKKVKKTKMAAWFVSNCATKSRRDHFVHELQNALLPFGYEIDVFGHCGKLSCPLDGGLDNCNSLLKSKYFFYLALENSFAEDYVTEKVLTAFHNDAVPVVYGGANYSRFLPPGSYIDGRELDPSQLAAIMFTLTHSPKEYDQYFNWKQHYTYHDPTGFENMCKICEALNDNALMDRSTVYEDFRDWWNPKGRC